MLQEVEGIKNQGGIFSYLVDKGRELAAFPKVENKKDYLLPGCLYNIWLKTEPVDGKLTIHADSDSKITRGSAALIVELLTDLRPNEIITANLEFLYNEVLKGTFKSSRFNSIRNLEDRIKMAALYCRRLG